MELEDINQAISKAERREAFCYNSVFRNFLSDGGDEWRLLFDVFGMSEHFEDPDEPFRAMLIMDGKRSFLPEDLRQEQVEFLQGFVQEVDDSEFQARINDVLWVVTKDHIAARKAVDAYLASAERLEDLDNWPPSAERYSRAMILARQVDRKGQLPEVVAEKFIERIRHCDGNDFRWLTYKLMKLLYEARRGDPVELACVCQKTADSTVEARTRRDYLELSSKFLLRANEIDGAEVARDAAARTYIEEADEAGARGGGLAEHHHLEAALMAFRQRPSLKDEIPALKMRLKDAANRVLEGMQQVSHEIDISSLVDATRQSLSSLPLDEALFEFVSFDLMDPVKLRDSVTNAKHGFFSSLFENRFFDYEGRVAAIAPGAYQPTDPGYEQRVSSDVQRDASLRRQLITRAQIVPGMHVLKSEHIYDSEAVHELLSGVPIVPDNKMSLLVRGLSAGFDWDFTLATHLLIPTMEAALRHISEMNGVVPRNMNAQGVEEAWGYDRLLSAEGIEHILGNKLTFELRSLLIADFGPKLRHNMAHGLVPAAVFEGSDAVYMWWLALRLALVPSSKFQAYSKTVQREISGGEEAAAAKEIQ